MTFESPSPCPRPGSIQRLLPSPVTQSSRQGHRVMLQLSMGALRAGLRGTWLPRGEAGNARRAWEDPWGLRSWGRWTGLGQSQTSEGCTEPLGEQSVVVVLVTHAAEGSSDSWDPYPKLGLQESFQPSTQSPVPNSSQAGTLKRV